MWRSLLAAVACFTAVIAAPAAARAEVVVLASSFDRIVRIDSSGQQTTFLTGFVAVTGMTFDANGNLFVADNQAGNIRRFSPSGQDLGIFAAPGKDMTYSLVFDPTGNLYVTNAGTSTIRKYAPTGQLLQEFSARGDTPTGIVVDGDGNLLVANLNSRHIRKLSPTGADLGIFAPVGPNGPFGLAFDASDNLYVTNLFGNQVREFSPTGADLGVFVSAGLNVASGLAFDLDGNLYVANNVDGTNGNVRKFSPAGQDLGTIASGLRGAVAVLVQGEPVPEPSSFLILGLGLTGLALHLLRRYHAGE